MRKISITSKLIHTSSRFFTSVAYGATSSESRKARSSEGAARLGDLREYAWRSVGLGTVPHTRRGRRRGLLRSSYRVASRVSTSVISAP